MKARFPRQALIGFVCFATLGSLHAAPTTLREAARCEAVGHFAKAEAILEAATRNLRLPESDRRQAAWERERLSRVRRDYALTKPALFAELREAVRDVTEAEFEQWVREGRFDARPIDGELRFVDVSVSNLFFRHAELEPRRLRPRTPLRLDRALLENARAIRRAALDQGRPCVLPKRLHVTMTLTVKSNAAPAGEVIRAWLPVPRRFPFQDQFEVLRTAPALQALAEPESPIRSVYFEQLARTNAETRFEIEYAYTAHGVWFDLQPERVLPSDLRNPDLSRFTSEAPHIEFTGPMKTLARSIVGAERNPMRRAKRFYDWIGENIRYSFAREYSTLGNLGDYCRTNRYGDCGQEALLFMTLCRLSGIPARWQSGWNLFPGGETIHDWCEIHLAPYGWVPVDPYMSIRAMRYAQSLTPEERRELRDFYFGGLTQYRMSANGDHNQLLHPAKQSFRSDNVDFQRGEVECAGRNLYFGQFSSRLSWKEEP